MALIGGSLGATLILWLASKLGLGLQSMLGLLVGGYLVIWFGVAGLIGWLLSGIQLERLTRKAILGGLLVFGGLWLGVGLLGNFVWLPWLLIARRLFLWPVGSVLLLPWFFIMGALYNRVSWQGKIGLWLAQSFILLSSLFLALRLSSELGFLSLILPLFPIILGLHAIAVALQRDNWAFALSGALFTSWIILAVFPLQ